MRRFPEGRLSDIGHGGPGARREATAFRWCENSSATVSAPIASRGAAGAELFGHAQGHDAAQAGGLVLAIEPMVNAGTQEVQMDPDGWTARTKDGKLSAHFEYSVAVTPDGPRLLGRDRGYLADAATQVTADEMESVAV